MELFILLLLSSIVSASINVTFVENGEKDFTQGRQCDREGYMCKNCQEFVSCRKEGNEFVAYTVAKCTDIAPCDETILGCVAGGVCRYKEFRCPFNIPSVQKLPDPYSCRQHWICDTTGTSIPPIKCQPPMSYNPNSKECDLLLDDNPWCTQSHLNACQRNDQKLHMTGTTYNYLCLLDMGKYPILYPYLDMNSIPSGTTTPSPSQSECKSEGYIADPMDCTKFFECISKPGGGFDKNPKQCRKGTRFDASLQRCVPGYC